MGNSIFNTTFICEAIMINNNLKTTYTKFSVLYKKAQDIFMITDFSTNLFFQNNTKKITKSNKH